MGAGIVAFLNAGREHRCNWHPATHLHRMRALNHFSVVLLHEQTGGRVYQFVLNEFFLHCLHLLSIGTFFDLYLLDKFLHGQVHECFLVSELKRPLIQV